MTNFTLVFGSFYQTSAFGHSAPGKAPAGPPVFGRQKAPPAKPDGAHAQNHFLFFAPLRGNGRRAGKTGCHTVPIAAFSFSEKEKYFPGAWKGSAVLPEQSDKFLKGRALFPEVRLLLHDDDQPEHLLGGEVLSVPLIQPLKKIMKETMRPFGLLPGHHSCLPQL